MSSRSVLACSLFALLFGSTLVSAAPSLRATEQSAREVLTQRKLHLAPRVEETCEEHFIACGETVTSDLTTEDCDLGDGTFFDPWVFHGEVGQVATISLESEDFDAFVFLVDPFFIDVVATDDDSGGGTNALLQYTLDFEGNWEIWTNNFAAASGDPGAYTLSLTCSSPGALPAAPTDLVGTALGPTDVLLEWADNSDDEIGFLVEGAEGEEDFFELGTVPQNTTEVIVGDLEGGHHYRFRVSAINAAGASETSNVVEIETPSGGVCIPDEHVLCLLDARFRVEVEWSTGAGHEHARVATLGDGSGYFWFFDEENPEVVVKAFDGCHLESPAFWVFAGGLTNVEVDLEVIDTLTGASWSTHRETGEAFGTILDTRAFLDCP